jgi:membrane associated rhomboid family serine protease
MTSGDHNPDDDERTPILTVAVSLVCVVIFLGALALGPDPSWEQLARWGYLSPAMIWDGAWWGVLTSVFVHLEPWHLAFNLCWFLILGGVLELEFGRERWLAFVVGAALASSGAQLATGSPGHGLSGVTCALFAFAWVTRRRVPAFRDVLTNRALLLWVVWLTGWWIATATRVMPVATAARLGGLLFGAGAGAIFLRRRKPFLLVPTFGLLCAAALVPIVACPWSGQWAVYQADCAQARYDYPAAIRWYRESLRRGADPKWAWYNVAVTYERMHDTPHFLDAIAQLRKVAPAQGGELMSHIPSSYFHGVPGRGMSKPPMSSAS